MSVLFLSMCWSSPAHPCLPGLLPVKSKTLYNGLYTRVHGRESASYGRDWGRACSRALVYLDVIQGENICLRLEAYRWVMSNVYGAEVEF
jgi:hypothetical protein